MCIYGGACISFGIAILNDMQQNNETIVDSKTVTNETTDVDCTETKDSIDFIVTKEIRTQLHKIQYHHYYNSRFDYGITYPSCFIQQEESANGDGCRFYMNKEIYFAARDTFAKKIVERYHVTDDIYLMYDSIARGSIVQAEKQIENNAVKPLIDDNTDFSKKCLYTLAAYYLNRYPTPSLAIEPLKELMESEQYSIFMYEIWRIWRFISMEEIGLGWLVAEEEYNVMKLVCLKTILAQIVRHSDDVMAVNQFILLSASFTENHSFID